MLKFIPITPNDPDLLKLIGQNENCMMVYDLQVKLYDKLGYHEPWIGYFAQQEEQIIGTCAFKGKPINGKVELAYFTFQRFEKQGLASTMCRQLVEISRQTDPKILITARTLPESNASTRILEKNGFTCIGKIVDPEEGEVWEWHFL